MRGQGFVPARDLIMSPGKQLFEQDRNLATSDAALVEEGVTSVDVSQYDRTRALEEEEQEQEGIVFSDSE